MFILLCFFFQKEKFPNGFFVVFVAKGDDYDCTGEVTSNIKNRTKQFTLVIKPSITYTDYVNAILMTLFAILIFYIVFGVIFFFCSRSSYVPRSMDFIEESNVVNTPTTITGEFGSFLIGKNCLNCFFFKNRAFWIIFHQMKRNMIRQLKLSMTRRLYWGNP